MDVKTRPEPPPLLFNLAELQSEANRRFKMPVDRVLEVAQSLYEKKHISYPRTDSRVLSTEVVPELPKISTACMVSPPGGMPWCGSRISAKLTVDAKSKRFVDDTKVTDHYAIIPTYQAADPEKLDGDAQKIYTLVVKRFLAIFYPPANTTRSRWKPWWTGNASPPAPRH